MSIQGIFDFPRDGAMNFPDDTQRILIVGTTGSGKTHAALWHLSRRSYDERPWIVYDWKRDEFISSIPGTFELDVHAPIPEHPGLYIVHPIPGDDDEAVTHQMGQIWQTEDIGVFVDEAMIVSGKNQSFRNLLIQGRSKHIPMILCTQRPVNIDRFAFSESEFKQVFRLQDDDDWNTMRRYFPQIPALRKLYPLSGKQRRHWSYYYDGTEDRAEVMRPVPDQAAIRSVFAAKLAGLSKVI